MVETTLPSFWSRTKTGAIFPVKDHVSSSLGILRLGSCISKTAKPVKTGDKRWEVTICGRGALFDPLTWPLNLPLRKIRSGTEANYGGRHLLFLGDRFRPEAMDCSFEWKTISQLSKRYGNPATTARWQMVCERDPDTPAFGVISRHPYHGDICAKAGNDNVASPQIAGICWVFPRHNY